MEVKIFLLAFLLQCLMIALAEGINGTEVKLHGCKTTCGDVNISYPFGIGADCSIDAWDSVTCNTTFHPPKPFLGIFEILRISLHGEVFVKSLVGSICYSKSGLRTKDSEIVSLELHGKPLTFSTKNKFTVLGCNTVVQPKRDKLTYNYVTVCVASCKENSTNGSCSGGNGCCQNPIPPGLKAFYVDRIHGLEDNTHQSTGCQSFFLAEHGKYLFNARDLLSTISLQDIPMVLNWAAENRTCKDAQHHSKKFACKKNSYCDDSIDDPGYLCKCKKGYKGNPYLGCQDIDECKNNPNRNPCIDICTNTEGSYSCSCPDDSLGDGTKNGTGCTLKRKGTKFPILPLSLGSGFGILLLLLVGGSWLYFCMKKRKLLKLKEKFFQQNGGLLFKQQISLLEGGAEPPQIFTSKELKRATNNYNQHRILGQGGYGTVYKGILPDLRIVAIKKSKTNNESQVGQFVNEVIILSQINHLNIVKLLGCCLETEVPLLVYEFVSHGNLFHLLHKNRGVRSSFGWEDRLRVAAQTAGALSYLHSAHSISIIHRDVKSANILLDAHYMAKVADFGISRLNPLDRTHISTIIQGTWGYLDPEYLHTSQLTEKSDVDSFGVILVEILTGQQPFDTKRSEEQRNYAEYFTLSVEENRLVQLLEVEILNEGDAEQVQACSC